jgi:hypothetical protein
LALAAVLDVSPLHLIVPPWPSPLTASRDEPNDEAPYQVTPTTTVPCYRVRQWIRGHRPLPDGDPRAYFSTVPRHEWGPADVQQLIEQEERQRAQDREREGRGDG